MATGKRGRGRPVLAAQTLDEALARHFRGESPKRPRNEFEQQVMRQTRGRKIDKSSPSQCAAEYALYLSQHDGLSMREAAKRAAEAYKLHPDTVRKLAHKLRGVPLITITKRGPAPICMGVTLPKETVTVPILHSVTTLRQRRKRIVQVDHGSDSAAKEVN